MGWAVKDRSCQTLPGDGFSINEQSKPLLKKTWEEICEILEALKDFEYRMQEQKSHPFLYLSPVGSPKILVIISLSGTYCAFNMRLFPASNSLLFFNSSPDVHHLLGSGRSSDPGDLDRTLSNDRN